MHMHMHYFFNKFSICLQANVIMGLEPGEVFTQRNVGNQVSPRWIRWTLDITTRFFLRSSFSCPRSPAAGLNALYRTIMKGVNKTPFQMQASHTDLNVMSCLEYAVKELKVIF